MSMYSIIKSIIKDYGGYEGWRWESDDKGKRLEFGSVDAALKYVLPNLYGQPFLVVQVIEWEAKPKT